MDKPVIAVIACVREVESELASIVKQRYLEAVAQHADAVPVVVPALGGREAASAIVARVDAVLLTGSNSNIEPARYGGQGPGTPPYDPGRDGVAGALIAAAIDEKKPVFGVCRGLQEINVAFGGTLADERTGPAPDFSHHAPDGADLDAMFGHAHGALAVEGGTLAGIVGTGPLTINSVHYQRVKRLGDGLMVEAMSDDGVVEAVSAPGVLAVQWHPEWRAGERAHDRAFWRYVGEAARSRGR